MPNNVRKRVFSAHRKAQWGQLLLELEHFLPKPGDLDCRTVSKKYFKTSFLGQEHLVV
jgi:hypothetical protein